MSCTKNFLFICITLSLSSVVSGLVNADVLTPTVATDIQEPAGTYDSTAPTLINLLAKTVLEEGNCIVDDYNGCTFADVLNDIVSSDDFKPEVKVHITGDGYPDDGLLSNAKIRQRGDTSRYASQKSFRIKLDKNIPLWRGERRIQLLKSFFELSRVRNKLSYDLFADIPHIPSMRSQFVNLTLEDQGVAQNLGLYTQVEYFGKEYLERRGWDKDSRIYKAEHFYFQYRDAFTLNAAGEPLDEVAFEELIEIKRGDTHQELVEMIQAVNNRDLDFQTDIFDKYFNQDNYLTWYAINILTNNADTDAHNYYLYNPIDTDNFYFVPWDYDYAWGASIEGDSIEFKPRWWYSHAYLWSNNFHERFLGKPGNLALLTEAVAEIRQNYLTPQKIAAKRDAYYDVIFPLISSAPDWDYIYLYGTNPEKVAQYNQIFDALSNNVEENYARFLARVDDPMPFYMSDPVIGENNNIFFEWDESKSLSNQIINYDLEIATDKFFSSNSIIQTIKAIQETEYLLNWTHPKGTYYFKVVARDSANPDLSWQIGYDSLSRNVNSSGVIYGIKEFYVSEDGVVNPPEPNESVSNPIVESSIVVDGDAADWNSLTAFSSDPDDILNDSINVIDWNSSSVAHSDQNIYFLYKNHSPINSTSTSSYIPWGWQVFIDSDNNPTTGFQYSSVVGADYIIEGTTVERYAGTGTNWNWDLVGSVNGSTTGKIREFSFPKNWLGESALIKLVFQGANEAYGGNTTDVYPDGAQTGSASVKYFEYSFGPIEPPENQAPIATGQSLSLVENTSVTLLLEATDAEADPLSLIITQQPTQGLLTFNANSLTISYTPNLNFQGNDTFSFKVNDGQQDSNIAIVNLEVTPNEPVEGISNPVIVGGITIDGNNSDWNNLTFFEVDPADIATNNTNPIDWLSAAMAHSSDTVYLTYQNKGLSNPPRVSGTSINWGWQTFIDSDRDINSGYSFNEVVGAEYLIEGHYVYQYAGTGTDWEWIELGKAVSKYQDDSIELSFPRSWLTQLNNINLAFYGNNASAGGNTQDNYPNQGSLSYSFGGTGAFGELAQVASLQRQSSPSSHQPVAVNQTNDETDNTADTNPKTTEGSGGGSFSWLILISSMLLFRRKLLVRQLRVSVN